MKIELLSEVDSTNEYIRRYLDGGENVIVAARRQTAGRGTKGRSFLSELGGVYFTALVFPEDLTAERAFLTMAHAAVAACKTAERFGVFPEIKWANDVLVRGKKLCGILTENILSQGRVKASIVGVGFNVQNDLSGVHEVAIRLNDVAERETSADEVREELISQFCRPSTFEEYVSRVRFLGKEVCVTEGARQFIATAKRILPDGRLEIMRDGECVALSAAEISLRSI